MNTLNILLLIGCAILLIIALVQASAKKKANDSVEELEEAHKILRIRNQTLNNMNQDLASNQPAETSWQLASSNFDIKGDIVIRVENAKNPNALKNGTVHFTLDNGEIIKSYIKKSNKSVPVFFCVKK